MQLDCGSNFFFLFLDVQVCEVLSFPMHCVADKAFSQGCVGLGQIAGLRSGKGICFFGGLYGSMRQKEFWMSALNF